MKEEKFDENRPVENSEELAEEQQNLDSGDTREEVSSDDLILQQHAKIAEMEAELEQLRNQHLRKAADMDNMRKRLLREKEQLFQSAREAAINEFLPVSDDLVRTLDAMKEGDAKDAYIEGIQLVADKFDQVLAKYEVTRIDQTGVPFDVDLHDAMMRIKPEDDSVESGTVLQVIENGYTMGGKTLRHAKVIVSE